MKEEITCTIFNRNGECLFNLNYIPSIGNEITHTTDFNLLHSVEHDFKDEILEHWKYIDHKRWIVYGVFTQVRNINGKCIYLHSAEVILKED